MHFKLLQKKKNGYIYSWGFKLLFTSLYLYVCFNVRKLLRFSVDSIAVEKIIHKRPTLKYSDVESNPVSCPIVEIKQSNFILKRRS